MQEAIGVTASEVLRLSDMGVDERAGLNEAVRGFLKVSEGEIVRWIQLRSGALLVVQAPEDECSAEFYVYDRRGGVFYLLELEDGRFGGYTTAETDSILTSYRLLRFAERPWLLRAEVGASRRWLARAEKPGGVF